MIQAKLYNILATLGIDTAEIEPSAQLINYMDSLDLVEFEMAIESEFSIKRFDIWLDPKSVTLNDVIAHLEDNDVNI